MSEEFESIDAALAAVMKALPDCWWFERLEFQSRGFSMMGGGRSYHDYWEASARGPKDRYQTGVGIDPIHSLSDLLNNLRLYGHG